MGMVIEEVRNRTGCTITKFGARQSLDLFGGDVEATVASLQARLAAGLDLIEQEDLLDVEREAELEAERDLNITLEEFNDRAQQISDKVFEQTGHGVISLAVAEEALLRARNNVEAAIQLIISERLVLAKGEQVTEWTQNHTADEGDEDSEDAGDDETEEKKEERRETPSWRTGVGRTTTS